MLGNIYDLQMTQFSHDRLCSASEALIPSMSSSPNVTWCFMGSVCYCIDDGSWKQVATLQFGHLRDRDSTAVISSNLEQMLTQLRKGDTLIPSQEEPGLPCQVNQKTMADLLRSYLCAVPSSVL
jgi:hypothetical protein